MAVPLDITHDGTTLDISNDGVPTEATVDGLIDDVTALEAKVAAYVDPATGTIGDVINALITAGLMESE